MQIIARRTLRHFWDKHPPAETPLKVWYAMVAKAAWTSPADIKRQFGGGVITEVVKNRLLTKRDAFEFADWQ